MHRLLFIIVLLLSAVAEINATDLVIIVRDKQSFLPLPGTEIRLNQGDKSITTFTNKDGTLTLHQVQFPITLICLTAGYNTLTKELNACDSSSCNIEIFLTPSAINLNDVVVTGQVIPILAKQSIYKVQTISAEELQKRGSVTLNDALSFELNNLVNNDNVLGSSVSMNGISGQNIKILVNGIPLSGRENGNIDLGQLNLVNIKRVEMIQGPMNVIYGSNAMGGVINLITQTPEKRKGFGIRTLIESVGRYNFSGYTNLFHKNHQTQINLARNFFQGWNPQGTGDRFQLWKPKTQYTGDINHRWQATEQLEIQYFGSILSEKITNKGTPIINPYEGYAFDEYYRTRRILNSINTTWRLTPHETFTTTNSYTLYARIKNRFRKDLVTMEQVETKSASDQDTSIFNTLNLRGVISSDRFNQLQLQAGYDWNYDIGKSFRLAQDIQHIQDLGLFSSLLYTYKNFLFNPLIGLPIIVYLLLRTRQLYTSSMTSASELNYAHPMPPGFVLHRSKKCICNLLIKIIPSSAIQT
jgi:Outer membrane receptor for ferrienterochelin and colicins